MALGGGVTSDGGERVRGYDALGLLEGHREALVGMTGGACAEGRSNEGRMNGHGSLGPGCVSSVLSRGNGKKNMLPLHAFSELYMGTLAVYVPSLTIIW